MDEPLEERPDLRPPPSESLPVLLEPREVAVPVRGCHEKGEQQVHRDLANERARVSVESLDLRVRVRVRVQSPVEHRTYAATTDANDHWGDGRRFCAVRSVAEFPSLTRTLGPCTTGKSRVFLLPRDAVHRGTPYRIRIDRKYEGLTFGGAVWL